LEGLKKRAIKEVKRHHSAGQRGEKISSVCSREAEEMYRQNRKIY
jgi:hypothetical protein